jgi:hypothetical protein
MSYPLEFGLWRAVLISEGAAHPESDEIGFFAIRWTSWSASATLPTTPTGCF